VEKIAPLSLPLSGKIIVMFAEKLLLPFGTEEVEKRNYQ